MDEETKMKQSLTPVKFPEMLSPKAKTDETALRLETILKAIHSNHLKWQATQKRGISLCTSIEAIKSRCLESSDKYPEQLKSYCDKLAIMLTIFEDVSKATNELIQQLTALSKLNKNPNKIYFRTWKLENFLNFINKIKQKYELEIQIKRIVTKEIAHSITRCELILHTSCWQYPQYVNEYVNLLFSFFTLEINNLIKS